MSKPLIEIVHDLRELEAKATPGPWTREKPPPEEGFTSWVAVAATPGRQAIYAQPPGGSFPSSDCSLIAESRTHLPRMIAALEAAKELVDALELSQSYDVLRKFRALLLEVPS